MTESAGYSIRTAGPGIEELCSMHVNRGECVEDLASLGCVAVRGTVNFEIAFYVLLRKYRPVTSRINFYVLRVLREIRHHMCVFA